MDGLTLAGGGEVEVVLGADEVVAGADGAAEEGLELAGELVAGSLDSGAAYTEEAKSVETAMTIPITIPARWNLRGRPCLDTSPDDGLDFLSGPFSCMFNHRDQLLGGESR